MYFLIYALWLLSLQYHALAAVVPFDDWQHQRVVLKDVSIHLRYQGTGPPLVLVHGYPQHSVSAVSVYALEPSKSLLTGSYPSIRRNTRKTNPAAVLLFLLTNNSS